MDEPACPGCRDLLNRVAELEARVAELTRNWRTPLAPASVRPPRSARGRSNPIRKSRGVNRATPMAPTVTGPRHHLNRSPSATRLPARGVPALLGALLTGGWTVI